MPLPNKVERRIEKVEHHFDHLVEGKRRQIARLRKDEEQKVDAIRRGATRMSENGLEFIASWEGYLAKAYQDIGGIWTIGYGHTGSDVGPGDVVTRPEALKLLHEDARVAQAAVDNLVKVHLSQPQFDALVSFTFNCGTGAIATSTLLRLLNAGQYSAVPDELMQWVNVNGHPVEGLVRRRAAEAVMWRQG